MEDLFEREQIIFDTALKHITDIENGESHNVDDYIKIVREYGRLLKQLRRVTKISDRTAVKLNTSNLDLLDKVHYDALTGIYNRRFMEESMSSLLKNLSRAEGVLSVLIMDIDFFKKYNDTYGHSMGDICLRNVAEALNSSLSRSDDFVARYGGEEFVAVLPNTNEDGARTLADRFLANIIACNIPHKSSSVASCVTISIGITTGCVKHEQSGVDYIKCADKALYISKQNGRNKCTFIDFEEDTKLC